MTKHGSHWKMMLACGIPLALVILLPLFGITGNWIWLLALGGMIVAHLFMGGHGSHSGHEHKKEFKDASKPQNINPNLERRKI